MRMMKPSSKVDSFYASRTPALNVAFTKSAYRPGETVIATIDIENCENARRCQNQTEERVAGNGESVESPLEMLLIENLVVDLKGFEKLDPSWLQVPRTERHRGERVILESQLTAIVTNVAVEKGGSKSYAIRATLPKVLPPSYRGTAARYFYFLTVIVQWSIIFPPPDQVEGEPEGNVPEEVLLSSPPPLEMKLPFRIWTLPEMSGLSGDERDATSPMSTSSPSLADDHYGPGGIVPVKAVEVEIQWRERNSRSRWAAPADPSLAEDDEDDTRSEASGPVVFHSSITRSATTTSAMVGGGARGGGGGGGGGERRSGGARMKSIAATATVTEIDGEEAGGIDGAVDSRYSISASLSGFVAQEPLLTRNQTTPPPRAHGTGEFSSVRDRLGTMSMNEEDFKKKIAPWQRTSSLLEMETDTSTLSPLRIGAIQNNGGGIPLMAGQGSGESPGENSRGRIGPLALNLVAGQESSLGNGSAAGLGVGGSYRGPLLHQRSDSGESSLANPLRAPSSFGSFTRGRTYNIRIDDQILVKFTPRSPQPTYYLGDVVSGTLSFPQATGPRQCLEVTVLLETHEVIHPNALHQSRRAAIAASSSSSKMPLRLPVVQMEVHEVTADMAETHFLFSIPPDAPPAFATPLFSVQWVLRFEFVASCPTKPGSAAQAKNGTVNHPLANGVPTERVEWSIPLKVHAPLPKFQSSLNRDEPSGFLASSLNGVSTSSIISRNLDAILNLPDTPTGVLR